MDILNRSLSVCNSHLFAKSLSLVATNIPSPPRSRLTRSAQQRPGQRRRTVYGVTVTLHCHLQLPTFQLPQSCFRSEYLTFEAKSSVNPSWGGTQSPSLKWVALTSRGFSSSLAESFPCSRTVSLPADRPPCSFFTTWNAG